MTKQPYIPFYTGDWKKDPKLSRCAPATRGIWIDLLCDMHELDRCGELRGSTDELAVAARTTPEQLVHALTDLQAKDAADVEQRNGVWTVRNRRMYAESRKRKLAAERQLRFRNKDSNAESNGEPAFDIDIEFELFWKVYPKGRKTSKGPAREAFSKALAKADAPTIIAAAKAYAASDVGRGQYVKMPSTWLNQECWNDDREAWRDRDGKQPACREYVQVTYSEFMDHFRAGEFNGKPGRRTPDADGFCWVYGQLKDGRKLESHNKPGWTPTP